MPNRDGKGPEGKGALTGRGLGNCDSPESSNDIKSPRRGRGLANRFGFGKGNRRRQGGNRDV